MNSGAWRPQPPRRDEGAIPPERDCDVVLAIANRRIAITLVPASREFPGHSDFRAFVAPPGGADARLCLRGISVEELSPSWQGDARLKGEPWVGRPILGCRTVERRYSGRGSDEVVVPHVALVDFFRPSSWDLESLSLCLGEPMRHVPGRISCLLGSHLAATGGLLLHGAGMLIDGAAAAVIGPSGAGKTTAAHLIGADHLLSDDAIAVTDVNAQPWLHATPLGRESDGPGRAPLRALFFPKKQAGFALRPMSKREALLRAAEEQADTFAGVFLPSMRGLAIRNLARLLHKVPAYELGFSLDGIDREAIRRVLTGS